MPVKVRTWSAGSRLASSSCGGTAAPIGCHGSTVAVNAAGLAARDVLERPGVGCRRRRGRRTPSAGALSSKSRCQRCDARRSASSPTGFEYQRSMYSSFDQSCQVVVGEVEQPPGRAGASQGSSRRSKTPESYLRTRNSFPARRLSSPDSRSRSRWRGRPRSRRRTPLPVPRRPATPGRRRDRERDDAKPSVELLDDPLLDLVERRRCRARGRGSGGSSRPVVQLVRGDDAAPVFRRRARLHPSGEPARLIPSSSCASSKNPIVGAPVLYGSLRWARGAPRHGGPRHGSAGRSAQARPRGPRSTARHAPRPRRSRRLPRVPRRRRRRR